MMLTAVFLVCGSTLLEGFRPTGFGDHHLGDQDAGRGREQAGRREMPRIIATPEHADVAEHYRTRDRRHSHRHQQEEFGSRHALEVGLYDQRGLGHAQKQIRNGRETLGPGRAHRPRKQRRQSIDHPLHDSDVIEDGEHASHGR